MLTTASVWHRTHGETRLWWREMGRRGGSPESLPAEACRRFMIAPAAGSHPSILGCSIPSGPRYLPTAIQKFSTAFCELCVPLCGPDGHFRTAGWDGRPGMHRSRQAQRSAAERLGRWFARLLYGRPRFPAH